MAQGSFTARASHRHLAKGGAFYAVARGGSSVLSLVILAILSRHLGAAEFGAWAVLVSLFQLVSSGDLGFTAGVRIRIIKLLARGGTESAIRTFLQSSLVLGGICVALGLTALVIIPLTHWLGLPPTPSMRVSAWVAIEIALISLPVGIAANLFFSYMETVTVSALEIMRSLAQSGLILLLAYLHAPFEMLVIAYYGAYLASCFFALAIFVRRRNIKLRHLMIYRRVNFHLMTRWLGLMLARSLLFCVSGAVFSFLMNGGAIMISHLLSVNYAGDYSILVRMISAGLAMSAAVLASYSGGYGAHYHTGNFPWVRRSLLLFSGVTFAVWFACSPVLLFAGPWIIHLWFGRWITDMSLIFAVAVWSLFLGLYQIFWSFLQSAGRMWIQSISGVVLVFAYMGLAALWVPQHGVTGAVWASCVATACWLFLAVLESVWLIFPTVGPNFLRQPVARKRPYQ